MKKNLKDKKSLNIAMLGHKRIPSREGGIEIVVEELATRMVTFGHKVTCYNRSGHHVSGKDFDGGKRKAYKGVRLKSVLTLDKKGLAAMTASVSGAICVAFGKYDVVHFHIETFYKRRYEKLWPFFALLCILDVVISPSANSVYEIFANLTMLQGLLPNPQISVVGVSWTLAVIFVFYLLFPFFCFLLFSKKRAWFGFIIAGIYNILCQLYFFDEQHVLGNFMERENMPELGTIDSKDFLARLDFNHRRMMDDLLFRYADEVLQNEESKLFISLSELHIGRRGREIVSLFLSKSSKEDQEKELLGQLRADYRKFGYSYGELLHVLYCMGRTPFYDKKLVHAILAMYTLYKNISDFMIFIRIRK